MQGKINIMIYVALWKRPRITELCFKSIARLRKHKDYNIQAFAVISEVEMVALCRHYDVQYVMHANEPLGEKKNYGLKALKNFDFDYLMEIGSDTVVLSELLDEYKNYIGLYDFFGVSDCAFICSETGSCRRVGGASTYGSGRMIHRSILDRMEWKLWRNEINRGLDNNSILKLQSAGIGYRQIKAGKVPLVVDIKSEVNIWPFNHKLGQPYAMHNITQRLSADETSYLKTLLRCSIHE